MRPTQKQDKLRLREIFQRLMEPFEGSEIDHLTTDDKLWIVFRPDQRPIYRRRVMKNMPVHGLWWTNESEWLRFNWTGYHTQKIKGVHDYDHIRTTRVFSVGTSLYIRENEDRIDIEGCSQVLMWDPVKKKRKGKIREWLTVSISTDDYKLLDGFLGPVHNGCSHKED